jgi:hypothetical protein
MKKLILIIVAALAFAACEGPMGPPGPQGLPGAPGQNGHDGEDGRDGQNGRDGQGTHWIREKFTVNPGDWVLKGGADQLNSYYAADFRWLSMTQEVYQNASVVAYIETEMVGGNRVKNGMPYVWHRGTVIDGKDYMWTETYDFDFVPGWMTFYLTFSDFYTKDNRPTEPVTFHVVVIWDE